MEAGEFDLVPAVPPIVTTFVARLRELLGDRLIAVILGGSWTMGDFVEGQSDLDLLVITADELTPDDLARLATLHDRLLSERSDTRLLEGDYVPRDWLTPTGTARPAPFFTGGKLQPQPEPMLSADNIANLRSSGVSVYGPPPAALLPDVTADQVRDAVRAMLRDPSAATTERTAAEEILDLVRSLCAVETGSPTTKAEGVRWALERLPTRWQPMVIRSDEIRRGSPVDESVSTLRRALAAMRAELTPARDTPS
jgi:hypothetical protein